MGTLKITCGWIPTKRGTWVKVTPFIPGAIISRIINARDVLSRLIHGLRNIYFRIPIMMERVPLLFLFSIGGVWIAFRFAAREYRYLCLFLVLQMQPLVWTNLSNPTARVPYGSLLPFELFLAALFLAWASELASLSDPGSPDDFTEEKEFSRSSRMYRINVARSSMALVFRNSTAKILRLCQTGISPATLPISNLQLPASYL